MDPKPAHRIADQYTRKLRGDAAHPSPRRGPTTPKKVKRTFSLTPEASKRLDVHAVGMEMEPGELVEKLIMEGLRTFFLTNRGGPGAATAVAPEPAEGD